MLSRSMNFKIMLLKSDSWHLNCIVINLFIVLYLYLLLFVFIIIFHCINFIYIIYPTFMNVGWLFWMSIVVITVISNFRGMSFFSHGCQSIVREWMSCCWDAIFLMILMEIDGSDCNFPGCSLAVDRLPRDSLRCF